MMKAIKDIVYFDFDKAASIWSQFEGGLSERVSTTEDRSKGVDGGTTIGIPRMAQIRLGADYSSAQSVLESKILHHDLLNRLDEQLSEAGLVIDLGDQVDSAESSPEAIRTAIGNKPYVKASGWSVVEDYKRILDISEKFKKLIDFIKKCALEAVKESPEYAKLQQTIDEARQNMNQIQDRNQKSLAKSNLQTLESSLSQMARSELSSVEQWLLDGIKLWIDTFMPNRINFRVYPFESCPSFQVICNLKRECFVDEDLEHLLYGYGNRPNVPLAVFGLITSLPAEFGHPFNPVTEFDQMKALNDKVSFEKAFRAVFAAMDEFEDWMRYSRYPNVTVHPIAVFRQFVIEPKKKSG